jgi:hypothetical protein
MPREDKNTFGEMRESGARKSLCIASAIARSRWTPAAGLMICASPISSRDSPARFAATKALMSDQATCPQEWPSPLADTEKAARRILEIANAVEPVQSRSISRRSTQHREDQRPIPVRRQGTPAEYSAGLELAIRLAIRAARERRDHCGAVISSRPR